jgi:hypothetical protein
MPRRPYGRFADWFTRPDSPTPLGWFRVGLALHALLQLIVIRGTLLDVYGQYGYVQWAITRANLYPGLPHLGDVVMRLERFGLSADQAVYALMGVYVLALCGLLLGVASRAMALAAWCLHYLWIHAGGGMVYGMDVFTHIALFYCILMPCGEAVSIRSLRRGTPAPPSTAAGVTRRMLQLHLCVVYLSAGMEKAMGVQWWNGEAMWRSLTMPTFSRFDLHWLAWVPWIAMLAGWFTMVVEIGYLAAIWSRRTRLLWFSMAIGMHLMIGLLMGMWLFGLIMVLLNLGAFGTEALADARPLLAAARLRTRRPARLRPAAEIAAT